MTALRRILTVSVIASSLATGLTADASAKVRDCRIVLNATTTISSARNMTCRAAKRDLKAYKGPIYKRHFVTPGGFHCRRVSGSALGGQTRCAKDLKAYRFEFGD